MRPGAFSNAGSLKKNISIAPGTVIQDAVGGTGADTIIGNDSDNVLRGNTGNDSIDGGSGNNASVHTRSEKTYAITITAGSFPSRFTTRSRPMELTRLSALRT